MKIQLYSLLRVPRQETRLNLTMNYILNQNLITLLADKYKYLRN